jgi:hypothetical protein
MKIEFTMRDPATFSRYGLLGICNKLAVALDEVMASTPKICGVETVRIFAVPPPPQHRLAPTLLEFSYRLINPKRGTPVIRKRHIKGGYAYLRATKGNTFGGTCNGDSRELRGSLHIVIRSLAKAVLRDLLSKGSKRDVQKLSRQPS